MLFICYDKCSTCQKARLWLDGKGLEYEVRPIKEENPSFEELRSWLDTSGLDVRRLFNTSGLLYRSMKLKDRIGKMSTDEALQLLSTDGMLVRRPILVTEDKVFFGFDEKTWTTSLLS